MHLFFNTGHSKLQIAGCCVQLPDYIWHTRIIENCFCARNTQRHTWEADKNFNAFYLFVVEKCPASHHSQLPLLITNINKKSHYFY